MAASSTWFQRIALPGLAFKAVVIGGGYATGRELAEFFLPSGPWGGFFGLIVSMVVWSGICILTFLFAYQTRSTDYRAFFIALLGRGWVLYEVAYLVFITLVLAVFGAAAGAIGTELFGWPSLLGTLLLMAGIAAVSAFGNDSVEGLFKYVSLLLYVVYAVFAALAVIRFGDRISIAFAASAAVNKGWLSGGLTYACYNVLAAVIILPVLRHLSGRRDAILAGLLCGPLAVLPAMIFFSCMVAFLPEIASAKLPSNFLLSELHVSPFQFTFQLMIFAALLESGTGSVHAFNARIASAASAAGYPIGRLARLTVAILLLFGAIFVASRFGLVALIARGYRGLAVFVLVVYIAPLLTYGSWVLITRRANSKSGTTGSTAPSTFRKGVLGTINDS
jgi:uncharacterized membrane protein YkvI